MPPRRDGPAQRESDGYGPICRPRPRAGAGHRDPRRRPTPIAVRLHGSPSRNTPRRTRYGAGPEATTASFGRRPSQIEDRMGVIDLGDHPGGRGARMRIERDEQRMTPIDRLQPVHPVGDREIVVAVRWREIVPARPGGVAPRHQRRIAMQNRAVGLVREGAEH